MAPATRTAELASAGHVKAPAQPNHAEADASGLAVPVTIPSPRVAGRPDTRAVAHVFDEPRILENDPRDSRLPVDASVNILHWSFVGSPPKKELKDYFRLARSLVKTRQLLNPSSGDKALCNVVLRRLQSVTAARARHSCGMAAASSSPARVASHAAQKIPEPVCAHDAAADELEDVKCSETTAYPNKISLSKLPSDFEKMLDSDEDTWDNGDISTKTPPLKNLVLGTEHRNLVKKR